MTFILLLLSLEKPMGELRMLALLSNRQLKVLFYYNGDLVEAARKAGFKNPEEVAKKLQNDYVFSRVLPFFELVHDDALLMKFVRFRLLELVEDVQLNVKERLAALSALAKILNSSKETATISVASDRAIQISWTKPEEKKEREPEPVAVN